MYRAVALFVAATLSGQWINEPARGIPRTSDGKPDLTAPAPGEAEKFIPHLGSSVVPGDDPTTFSTYFGHLEVQMTIEDAKYYSKAITFKYLSTLVPDDDLLEWVCTENEKDRGHIK